MKTRICAGIALGGVLIAAAAVAKAQSGLNPADVLREQALAVKERLSDAEAATREAEGQAASAENTSDDPAKMRTAGLTPQAAETAKDQAATEAKLAKAEEDEAKEALQQAIDTATRAEREIRGTDAEAYFRITDASRRAKLLSWNASDELAQALQDLDCLVPVSTCGTDVLGDAEERVMRAVRYLTTAQEATSKLPLPIETLIEKPLADGAGVEGKPGNDDEPAAANSKKGEGKAGAARRTDTEKEDAKKEDAKKEDTKKTITPAEFRWSLLMKGQVDDMTYQRASEVKKGVDDAKVKAVAAATILKQHRPPKGLDTDASYELLQSLTEARNIAETAAGTASDAEYPARCLGPRALTECDTAFSFNLALGLIQASDFEDPFPRVGFNLRSVLFSVGEDPAESDSPYSSKRKLDRFGDFVLRPNVIVDVALSSRAVDTKKDGSDDGNGDGDGDETGDGAGTDNMDMQQEFKLEDKRTWEGHGGFMVDLIDFYGGTGRPTSKLSLIGQLGGISPNDDGEDLLQHHIVGARFTWRGTSPPFLDNSFLNRTNVNGAFTDIAWGYSEQFKDKKARRMRIRSFLPVELQQGAQGFVGLDIDTDFGGGSDEVSLLFGVNVEVQKILTAVGIVLPSPR